MLALVLRGFLQRKLRVLLTGIAIALGVALMAGTYILTDTINHAFAEVFGIAYANKAVVVTEKETLGRGTGSRSLRAERGDARPGARGARRGGGLGQHRDPRSVAHDERQTAHQRRRARARRRRAAAAL